MYREIEVRDLVKVRNIYKKVKEVWSVCLCLLIREKSVFLLTLSVFITFA